MTALCFCNYDINRTRVLFGWLSQDEIYKIEGQSCQMTRVSVNLVTLISGKPAKITRVIILNLRNYFDTWIFGWLSQDESDKTDEQSCHLKILTVNLFNLILGQPAKNYRPPHWYCNGSHYYIHGCLWIHLNPPVQLCNRLLEWKVLNESRKKIQKRNHFTLYTAHTLKPSPSVS